MVYRQTGVLQLLNSVLLPAPSLCLFKRAVAARHVYTYTRARTPRARRWHDEHFTLLRENWAQLRRASLAVAPAYALWIVDSTGTPTQRYTHTLSALFAGVCFIPLSTGVLAIRQHAFARAYWFGAAYCSLLSSANTLTTTPGTLVNRQDICLSNQVEGSPPSYWVWDTYSCLHCARAAQPHGTGLPHYVSCHLSAGLPLLPSLHLPDPNACPTPAPPLPLACLRAWTGALSPMTLAGCHSIGWDSSMPVPTACSPWPHVATAWGRLNLTSQGTGRTWDGRAGGRTGRGRKGRAQQRRNWRRARSKLRGVRGAPWDYSRSIPANSLVSPAGTSHPRISCGGEQAG